VGSVLQTFHPQEKIPNNKWENYMTSFNLRRMRWAGHVAHMGKVRNANRIMIENLKGRDYLGDTDVDGRMKMLFILMKCRLDVG
jgi:hypothetical protein